MSRRNNHDLQIADILPLAALDEHVAIVGTSGAGKTYAAKRWAERLLETGARASVVDLFGVWRGLRASADKNLAKAAIGIQLDAGGHDRIATDSRPRQMAPRPMATTLRRMDPACAGPLKNPPSCRPEMHTRSPRDGRTPAAPDVMFPPRSWPSGLACSFVQSVW
jgi:hypothetical protein